MKPSVLIGAALAVIVAIVVWRAVGSGSEGAPTVLGSASAPSHGEPDPAPGARPRSGPSGEGDLARRADGAAAGTAGPLATALDPAEGERRVGGGMPCAFRLIDGRGRPVAGAEVSWCEPAVAGEHARGHETALGITTTDASGSVPPPGVGQPPMSDAVAWITHGEHLARWVTPGADPAWTEGDALVLEEAPRLEVSVTDRAGQPVEGALVVQRGLTAREAGELFALLPGAGGTLPDSPDDRALACLERRSSSDAAGRADAFPSRLPTHLWATADKRRSAPVRPERDGGPLVLILDDTFAAHGTVWSEASVPLARVLGLAELTNGDRRLLGSAAVAEDGSWGPIDLPLVEDAVRFVFRLEGGGYLPLEETRDPPPVGSLLTVEFRPQLGTDLLVRLVEDTPAGKIPVPHGRVTVTWSWAEGDERPQVRAWADEAGEATVPGTPTTLSWLDIEGSAGGYVSGRLMSVQMPNSATPGRVFEVELERAGRLHGRCLRKGEPVEDFRLIYWYDLFAARQTAHFSDREDGSFEITSAPLGDVTLLAVTGDDLAQSVSVGARVTAEGDTEVLLEVAEPAVGVGVVLDALTGKPVAGAKVDPQLLHARKRMGSRGRTFPVAADGSFEVAGFAAGVGRVEASAPGYTTVAREGSFRDGRVEFGVIALSRPQPLVVELLTSEPLPERGVWLSSTANGHTVIPMTRFPSDGVLVLEDVEPGIHTMDLCWHGGGMLSLGTIELAPGREWVVRAPFETPEPIVLTFVTEDGGDPPPVAAAVVRYRDANGNPTSIHMDLLVDGPWITDLERVEVPLVDADEITVEVLHNWNQDTVYASVHKRFAPGEPRTLRVPLYGPKLEVGVVDGDGKAVCDALVSAIGPQGLLRANELVDSEGKVTFQGLLFDRVSVFVQHDRFGLSSPEVVELSRSEDTFVELELDCDDDLVVRLLDGSRPIAGASLTLCAASPLTSLGYRATDRDGLATWERVGRGTWRVRSLPANCWKVDETFAFDGGPGPIDIAVRRLGNLAVEVTDADGQGVGGVPLEVRSSEFDTAVSIWVGEGRVKASTGAIATGEDGTVLLSHLPRGVYTCRATAPDGSPIDAEVDVAPLATTNLRLTLP
ncbi:MAG: carboxypeptidase-like regulatory domain-containing protein [Planctomycetota bacterium]|nr:carboxypeptidase-like regulatory domain-containing protein [Planctomycetota bacterium]